jgi:hypothetical protein
LGASSSLVVWMRLLLALHLHLIDFLGRMSALAPWVAARGALPRVLTMCRERRNLNMVISCWDQCQQQIKLETAGSGMGGRQCRWNQNRGSSLAQVRPQGGTPPSPAASVVGE